MTASDGRLEGRTVIVTGAGSGIGAAVSRRFARLGARVLLAHEPGDPRAAEDIAREIREAGGEAQVCPADVGRPDDVIGLVDACRELLGSPDIVVANAGIATRTPIDELSPPVFERMLAINLLGVHNLFGAAVASMRTRGWGRLLATASTSGHLYGWDGHAAYAAAKAGVVGLVRTYAVEEAASGITANAVAPGVIRSPQSLDPVNSLGKDGLAEAERIVPARRVGEPDDVAAAFAYFAGESAGYVNGQTLVVDGGLSVVEPV